MNNTQYIVWHTPRSGSNMLCSMLSRTGVAGIADYIGCGFFVGYPKQWSKSLNFKAKCDEYLKNQRTHNGVSGCKGGMSYFDNFRNVVGSPSVDRLLSSFTHHIFLQRADKLEQAISRRIAAATKIWSTIQTDKGIKQFSEPTYERAKIDNIIKTTHSENLAIQNFLMLNEITFHDVWYEDLLVNPEREISDIMQYLGVKDSYTWHEPIIRKQHDNRKTDFIRMYNQGE